MKTATILVRSMGKIFPARAMVNAEAANKFCESHKDWAVIAEQSDGIVYVASVYPIKEVASNLLSALLKDLDELI